MPLADYGPNCRDPDGGAISAHQEAKTSQNSFRTNDALIASVSIEVIANGQRQPAKAGTDFELQPGERKSLPFAQLGAGNFTVIITATAPVVAERETASSNTRIAEMGIPDRATAQIPKAITLDLGE